MGVSVPPSSMRARLRSGHGSVPTLSPLTKVPLRLPRSTIRYPLASPRMSACCRDIPGWSKIISFTGARPILVNPRVRAIVLPSSGPPLTISNASETMAIADIPQPRSSAPGPGQLGALPQISHGNPSPVACRGRGAGPSAVIILTTTVSVNRVCTWGRLRVLPSDPWRSLDAYHLQWRDVRHRMLMRNDSRTPDERDEKVVE